MGTTTQEESIARFRALLRDTTTRIGNELHVAAYQFVKQDFVALAETCRQIERLARDADYQRGLAGTGEGR